MPLGKEDIAHKRIANQLRGYEAWGLLKCRWWSYDASGENRAQKTGALLKAKGLKSGKSDYEFRVNKKGVMHHIYIEIKIAKNDEAGKKKQQDNQKEFESTCDEVDNNRYYLVSGIDHVDILPKVEQVLKDEGILIVN